MNGEKILCYLKLFLMDDKTCAGVYDLLRKLFLVEVIFIKNKNWDEVIWLRQTVFDLTVTLVEIGILDEGNFECTVIMNIGS